MADTFAPIQSGTVSLINLSSTADSSSVQSASPHQLTESPDPAHDDLEDGARTPSSSFSGSRMQSSAVSIKSSKSMPSDGVKDRTGIGDWVGGWWQRSKTRGAGDARDKRGDSKGKGRA
jgi:hypothetical protein